MIANRQRGLVNVYAFIATMAAVGLLLVLGQLANRIPGLSIDPSLNLLPYCMVVFAGMAMGFGEIRDCGYNLHLLGWFGGLSLAIKQVFYVSACVFGLMFAIKDLAVSRLFFGIYLLLLTALLTQMHAVWPARLARWLFGSSTHLPTLFIGSGPNLADLDDWIDNREHLGIRPMGLLSDETPSRVEQVIAPYLGKTDQLRATIQRLGIRQVVLLHWIADTERVESFVEDCEAEGCRFMIHNSLQARFARPLVPVQEGGRHFMALHEEPLEDPINRTAKRLLDIAVSLPVVVFILPPLCLLVWTLQRLQAPGPLFFVRPRGGQNRVEFNMLKFRSMYVSNRNINQQASASDNRIYPLGRWLRKTSLDEFPQFVNVLRGEMSVVGPRPHLPQHDTEFSLVSNSYRLRTLVKPGITGLAQVNGYRGEITDPEKLHRRVHWDLVYVSNWTFGMDVHLILKTFLQVFSPPATAY